MSLCVCMLFCIRKQSWHNNNMLNIVIIKYYSTHSIAIGLGHKPLNKVTIYNLILISTMFKQNAFCVNKHNGVSFHVILPSFTSVGHTLFVDNSYLVFCLQTYRTIPMYRLQPCHIISPFNTYKLRSVLLWNHHLICVRWTLSYHEMTT